MPAVALGCGGEAPRGSDSGADGGWSFSDGAYFAPRDAGPAEHEPCAAQIQLVAVDLPRRGAVSGVFGADDGALGVAFVDEGGEGSDARFAVADAATGALRFGADEPDDTSGPSAVARSDGWHVLWGSGASSPPWVSSYDDLGRLVARSPLTLSDGLTSLHRGAALGLQDGFLTFADLDGTTTAVVHVAFDGTVRAASMGLPAGRRGRWTARPGEAAEVMGVIFGPDGSDVLSVAPSTLASTLRPGLGTDTTTAYGIPEGYLLQTRTALRWLDTALEEVASSPAGFELAGVAGGLPRQVIVHTTRQGALLIGVADAAGHVEGGRRILVEGAVRVSGEPHVWQTREGRVGIARWAIGAEVLWVCGS